MTRTVKTIALLAVIAGLLRAGMRAMAADDGAGRDFVYVCTDGGAGGYEAFPDVCRRKDGTLMCVFYAGYGHVALPNNMLPNGGRIVYCTSADEGRTWSPPQILFDGPNDDRDPSIAQLRDGRL